MYKSEARKRFEKRCREQRMKWLKDNLLAITYIVGVVLLIIAIIFAGYHFWYNYIPSTVDTSEGQAKVYIEYRVVAGDTLDGICNRYFRTHGYDRPCSFEWEVINYNDLHGRINYLQVGETLELPMIASI